MGIFTKNTQFLKKYDVDKAVLGTGNFATVKKCRAKAGGEDRAVKIIDKSKVEDMNDITREIDIMEMIDHPNVIKLYEIFDEPKKMNLVLELVSGGELFDRIVARGNYTERDAADVMFTMCGALEYLHSKKVVHRDLKPENVLLATPANDAPIKIADFGLARLVSSKEMMKTACGTPGYVAPEVLQNKGYSSGAVDLWSAGVILYILLCGFPPFYEEELPALFDQILKGRYDFPSPWWDSISADAKNCVRSMLTVDPAKRITATDAKKHAWIVSASPTAKVDTGDLKKYQATKKLKKAAQKLIALPITQARDAETPLLGHGRRGMGSWRGQVRERCVGSVWDGERASRCGGPLASVGIASRVAYTRCRDPPISDRPPARDESRQPRDCVWVCELGDRRIVSCCVRGAVRTHIRHTWCL